VTATLEEIPRRFKVIETVREKFSCRDCEAITQPPAPFHATPRGYIGPQLLATIMFDKFGQHLPLNRQSQRFKCEGIDLSVSTLADQVGAAAFAAAVPPDRSACTGGRTSARRRNHGADPGERQDGDRADLELRAR
jgi:transposase